MKVHPACRVKYVNGRRYNDAMSVHAFGLTAILLALAGPDAASLLKERGLERQATTWIPWASLTWATDPCAVLTP